MFDRYAIFYTPGPGAFGRAGAAWLGWDSALGQGVVQPPLPDIDIAQITARPRAYGFHATLKAPFHLAHGQTLEALQDAVVACARRHPPVAPGPLALSAQHGFIALRPDGQDPAALHALAGAVVKDLDQFRSPLTPDTLAKRRKARLTERQDRHLLDWGYPFVMEDFHFHMTLTGRLKPDIAERVLPHLQALFAPHVAEGLHIDALTLMGQDSAGMFHQIHRAPLLG